MANSKTFIELEIEQADKFRNLLDQVISKLEKLDTGLSRVQQTTKGMTFKIQGIKDLERLGALSVSFGASSLKPFQNLVKIAGYIKQADSALQGMGGGKFTTLVSVMNSLVAVNVRLGALGNLTGFKASSLQNFSSTITMLVSLGTRAAKLDLAGLNRLPVVINVFGDIMSKVKNFASVGTVLRGMMQTSTINSLTDVIMGIVTVSKNAAKIQPAEIMKISLLFVTFQNVTNSMRKMGTGALSLASARLSLLTINSLMGILTAVADLAKAAKKISAADLFHIAPIVAALRMLMEGVRGVAELGDLGKGLIRGVVMKGIESFFVTLAVLANMGKKVDSTSFANLGAATDDLIKLLARLRGLGTITNFLGGFKTAIVTMGIGAIVKMMSDIAKAGGTGAKTLGTGIKSFGESITDLMDLASSGIFTPMNILRLTAMFVGFSLLSQIPTKMAIDAGIINEFIAVANAMHKIGLALEKMLTTVEGIKLSPLRINFFGITVNGLSRFAIVMKEFGKQIRKIVDAVYATEVRGAFFRMVQRDPISVEQVSALAKLIGATGRAMELLTQSAKRLGPVGASGLPFTAITRITTMFTELQDGLFKILRVLEDTRPLYKRFLGIGSGAPDAKNMEALAKLLSSLSSIIRRVFASMNSFTGGHFDVRADSKKNVDVRIQFLKDLIGSFRGFTGKTLPPNLSPVLAKVPEILKALAEVNNIDGGKGNANLKGSVDGLKEFFNALSKLNVKKTQALGDLGAALKLFGSIKALGSLKGLIDSVNQIVVMVNSTKIDKASFKGLKGAAEEISKALKVLEKVNVSPTQVEAVKAMAAALGSITKTKIQPIDTDLVDIAKVRRTGQATGQELSEAVERGVISGSLHIALFKLYTQVGLRILQALNPVAIAGKIIEGVQAVYHLGSRVMGIFDNIQNSIRNLGNYIDQMGDRLVSLGNTLNNTLGLGALTSSTAFTNAADFDQLLTQVQVFGNLTENELEQVRQAAVQVGIDFPQSAAQGLQAGLNLIKAGLGPAAVEATLPVAAALASLSDSGDLDAISRGVIQVVNSFRQLNPTTVSGFENASVVADILSSAADNSTASIESLFAGLENVGPAASAFGLDLQETTAILAIFSQNGLQGAEAGTQLRTILRTLQSAPAQTELRRLGVSITDTEGNFRSMVDIIGDLDRAMNSTRTVRSVPGLSAEDQALMQEAQRAYATASRNIRVYQNDLQASGVTEEQRATRLANYTRQQQQASEVIARLAGSNRTAQGIFTEIDRTQAQNAQTVLQLAGAYGQLGLSALLSGDDNAIAAFIAQMEAMPSAVDRAREMLDNFKGDVQQLQGSVETAGIVALQPLLDVYFRPMVQVLRQVVDGFLALPAPLQQAVGWFAALGSTLATVVGSSFILTGTLTSLGGNVLTLVSSFFSLRTVGLNVLGVFTGMVTGLATIAFVILPLVAALGAVALGVVAFRKVLEDNIGNAGQVFERLRLTIGSSLGIIRNGVDAVVEFFTVLFTGSRGGSGNSIDLLQGFGETIAVVFSRVDSALRRFNTVLVVFITGFRNFMQVFEQGFNVTDRFVRGQTQNEFLAWLFGATNRPPLTMESARAFLQTIQLTAGQLRLALTGIANAISTFVNSLRNGASLADSLGSLRSQLVIGAASLGSGLLKIVGELFNIDFSAATQYLDQGNLRDGVQGLLSVILDRIRGSLLNNRQTITDTLVTVFDALFVPGAMFERLAGWFGLTDVESVISKLRDAVSGGFRNIIETLFNILEGDDIRTALTKAFGPGIQPMFDFVNELGRAVQNIAGIIGGLIKAIFNPDVTGTDGLDIGGLVSAALGGASDILKSLNDVVLGPLSTALQSIDFTAIGTFFNNLFTGVSTFLTNIGSGNWKDAAAGLGGAFAGIIATIRDTVSALFSSVGGESSGSFVKSVGTALVGALEGAITFAFGTLATALGIDPTQFYADISAAFAPLVSAIQTGDPFLIVGNLGGAVVKAIGAAINLAISGIGQLLGIDTTAVQTFIRDVLGGVVDQITSLFSGEKGSLSGAVVNLIQSFTDVITKMFGVLQGVGGTGEAQALFTSIGTFLTDASGVAVGVIAIPLNAIRVVLDRIATMDPTSVQLIMTAIGGMMVLMAAQSLVGNAGAIVTMMRTFGGSLLAGAQLFIFVDLLAQLIANFRELGDISTWTLPGIRDAIVDSFIGLSADIAGVFGLDGLQADILNLRDTFGTTLDQLRIILIRAGAVLQYELAKLGNSISAGLQLAAAQMQVGVDRAANIAVGRGETFDAIRFAFSDQLQQAINTGGEGVDLGAFFRNVVTQANINGYDVPESLRQEFITRARGSLDSLMIAFRTDLQESTATEDQAAMRQTISDWFLLITGLGDPQLAFNTILQQGDFSFVQSMLDTLGSMTAEELAASNVDGTVVGQMAQSILDAFNRGLLSQDQAFSLLGSQVFAELSPEDAQRVREQIQRFIDQVQTVVDEVSTTTPIEFKGRVQAERGKAGLDKDGEADGQDLESMLGGSADAFVRLREEATLTSQSLMIQLGMMTVVTTPLIGLMNVGLTGVRDRFSEILYRLNMLVMTMILTVPVMTIQAAVLQTGLTTMAINATTELDKLVNKLNDIKRALDEVLSTLGLVNSAPVNVPQTSGARGTTRTTPVQEARGGSTNAGQTYQVAERDRPELFQSGEKFYMISPTAGRVIPLARNTPRLAAAGAGGGNISVNYNPSTNIEINGSNLDVSQLSQVVYERLQEAAAQQREDIVRTLRTRGRSGS